MWMRFSRVKRTSDRRRSDDNTWAALLLPLCAVAFLAWAFQGSMATLSVVISDVLFN